jgi:predicted Zn-dependent protease
MSAWKLVYRIFCRIVLPIFLLTSVLAASGCSDSTQSANAKGALAQSQLDAGQLAAARKTIGEAIADRDDIAELHLLRARIESQAKSPATAFSAYSAALALDSANMEALVGVAQLGLQLGHIGESEDATNRILALDPKQPNALLLKGLHDIIKRRYEDSVANADALLQMAPGDENAVILKARSLAFMGKPDEAFAIVEGARKNTGDTLSMALTLLELHRVRGDGTAIVPLLERIRQLAPEDADHDVDEADTLYKLGADARARLILRRRLLDPRIDEKSAAAIAGLWKEYDPEPLDAAALAEFAKKAGIPARKALARLYLDRNDPARANVALSGAPAIDDIVALRARAGVAQGRLDESLAQAEAILARDRTHCEALVVKAQVLLAKRRTDDAIAASTLASTTCPQMPIAFVTLARAQEADGNKAGAMIAFRDAFDRNDQDSALVRTYSAWLEQQGQGTRAVSIARRLTNNAPSLFSGWRLYGELCARIPATDCGKEAEAGLSRARQRFGVDPRSDEPRPTGLFGRLARE